MLDLIDWVGLGVAMLVILVGAVVCAPIDRRLEELRAAKADYLATTDGRALDEALERATDAEAHTAMLESEQVGLVGELDHQIEIERGEVSRLRALLRHAMAGFAHPHTCAGVYVVRRHQRNNHFVDKAKCDCGTEARYKECVAAAATQEAPNAE